MPEKDILSNDSVNARSKPSSEPLDSPQPTDSSSSSGSGLSSGLSSKNATPPPRPVRRPTARPSSVIYTENDTVPQRPSTRPSYSSDNAPPRPSSRPQTPLDSVNAPRADSVPPPRPKTRPMSFIQPDNDDAPPRPSVRPQHEDFALKTSTETGTETKTVPVNVKPETEPETETEVETKSNSKPKDSAPPPRPKTRPMSFVQSDNDSAPPPRPSYRPSGTVHIQPAPAIKPHFSAEKADLEALAQGEATEEGIQRFKETAAKIDEEGPYGAIAKELGYPALGLDLPKSEIHVSKDAPPHSENKSNKDDAEFDFDEGSSLAHKIRELKMMQEKYNRGHEPEQISKLEAKKRELQKLKDSFEEKFAEPVKVDR